MISTRRVGFVVVALSVVAIFVSVAFGDRTDLNPETDLDPDSVFGVWELVDLDGRGPQLGRTDHPISMTVSLIPAFSEPRRSEGALLLTGNGGCNGFGGEYIIEDGRIEATPIASSLIGCGDQVERQEALLGDLVISSAIVVEDWVLTLVSDDGVEAVFQRGQRPGGIGVYQVESVDGRPVEVDASLQVGFGGFTAFAGCHFSGPVEVVNGNAVFGRATSFPGSTTIPDSEDSPELNNDFGCDRLTDIESAIAAALSGATTETAGDQLTLTGSTGTVIIFRHA